MHKRLFLVLSYFLLFIVVYLVFKLLISNNEKYFFVLNEIENNVKSNIKINQSYSFFEIQHLPKHEEEIIYRINISKKKFAWLAIGLPTVKRPTKSYLIETINSLVKSLNADERKSIIFVVFIAEYNDMNFVKTTIESLFENFNVEINEGLIDIVAPSPLYYPNFNELELQDDIFHDSADRIKWRTKQNYDVSYLMNFCYKRSQYYLQLEDDVITVSGFVSKIKNYISFNERFKKKWMLINFSELGFIGKLFRNYDLPVLINFFLSFAFYRPIDLLPGSIFEIILCHPNLSKVECGKIVSKMLLNYRPSLFQHIGIESSLNGKQQNLKVFAFFVSMLKRTIKNNLTIYFKGQVFQ